MEENINTQLENQAESNIAQVEKVENGQNAEVEIGEKKKKSVMTWLLLVLLMISISGGVTYLIKSQKILEVVKVPNTETPVALKWLHQAQFAGNYVALGEGYYQDNGLEVTLIPYDLETSAIDLVASGSAMFGVTGADELLLARSQGIPVVALAVIYQESPVVAYTLKSSGIESVQDFRGKKVGYEFSGNVAMTIDNMISEGGLDPNKDIIREQIGYDASQLISGEVDVATGYLTNEPLYAEEQGYEVVYIKPSQYGIIDYADVLFTSQEIIDERPELVRGYVQATLAGWEKAFENKTEAINNVMIYLDDKNQSSRRHQTDMLEASEQLIRSRGIGIGQMTYVRWHRLYEEMKEVGIITQLMDVSQAYTQEFLEK